MAYSCPECFLLFSVRNIDYKKLGILHAKVLDDQDGRGWV
jgi:hypothetical protein